MNPSPPVNRSRRGRPEPLAILLIAVSLGIVLDYFLVPAWSFGLAGYLVVCASWLVVRTWLWCSHRNGSRLPESVLVLAMASMLGGAWHHAYWRVYPANEIGLYSTEAGYPVRLIGTVKQRGERIPASARLDFDRRAAGERTRLLVRAVEIQTGEGTHSVSGNVIVLVDGKTSEIQSGDQLNLIGTLSRPPSARSDGEFDVRRHYRTQRINATLFVRHASAIEVVGRSRHWAYSITRWIDSIRDHLHRQIQWRLSEENSRLLAAMLLGKRSLIDREQNNRFLTTGTMHLLAISGLHVGILCSMLFLISRTGLVNARWILVMTILFVIFYCFLTHLRPPVIRASILIVLWCLAKLINRRPFSVNSLALAGLIVIMLNPSSLFLPGPQLSFLAVATLIMVNERQQNRSDKKNVDSLDRFLARKRVFQERLKLWLGRVFLGCCVTGGSIWIATLPLVADAFHVVSPIGILANLLLAIPIWIAIQSGFLMLVLGWIPGMGWIFGLVSESTIRLIRSTVDLCYDIPSGHWWSPGPEDRSLCVFYLIFLALFLAPTLRLRLRGEWILLGGWFLVMFIIPSAATRVANAEMKATFIDVGHGTSVLLELPDGKVVLYDAGSLNSSTKATERISSVLWSKRIRKLDWVILSHADLDHYNALPELLDRFSIGEIAVSRFMFDDLSDIPLSSLHQSIFKHGIHPVILDATSGLPLSLGASGMIKVLHPSFDFRGGTDNSKSIVLLAEFAGKRILLPGDLEAEGQEELLSNLRMDCDVLMAPHHGSKSSDHQRFINWSTPEQVVFSSGKGKVPDSVRKVYRLNHVKMHSTYEHGTIEISLSRRGVSCRRFIDPPGR